MTATRTKLEQPIDLPCHLGEPDKLSMGKRLADVLREQDRLSLERKAAMDGFKQRASLLAEEAHQLSGAVSKGYVVRPIECEEMRDYASGRVSTVRLDTGEVLNERAMTTDERQLGFDALYGHSERKE